MGEACVVVAALGCAERELVALEDARESAPAGRLGVVSLVLEGTCRDGFP